LERPAFQQCRRDAQNGKFDAIVVHRFDRISRDRTDALAIKSLLRIDYGIKVLSVTEPSEDSDGPIGALVEGIMASVAEWYSQNLSREAKKGKLERAYQGLHNNRAPFGMTKDDNLVLIPDENEIDGLLLAFQAYSTGRFSDQDVANLLNDNNYKTKSDRPFSKDTVRDMLKNRTYLGYVKYQPYERNDDGSRSYGGKIQWFDGLHDAVVVEELFLECQKVREGRVSHRKVTRKGYDYLLRDIAYCYNCCANPPDFADKIAKWGRMRCKSSNTHETYYYRCRSREFSHDCSESSVNAQEFDRKVVNFLHHYQPSATWRESLVNSINNKLYKQNELERLQAIRETIERMDFRWDNGFITDKEDYLQKRLQLQEKLEQLDNADNERIAEASDLLENFGDYWEACEDDGDKQYNLIKLIVDKVYIKGDSIVGILLYGDCYIELSL